MFDLDIIWVEMDYWFVFFVVGEYSFGWYGNVILVRNGIEI